MADIKVYGAAWCPDCKRSKKFLSEQRVPYDWTDIDQDPEALRFVEPRLVFVPAWFSAAS